ncbi:MAG: ribosomal protein S18-alanine N-acetyltransferase [Deltaproteobacteria bacterium]|nr:ribosomal protein S18-alanine N-acetyltransferase [Deltaproteobacteria bacterium]
MVRWKIQVMDKSHLEQVMEIERASFLTPWTEKMFLEELASPLSFHFVASLRGRYLTKGSPPADFVLCYIIFWMFREEVHILNLATHPDFRRLRIAQSLLLFTMDFSYKRGGIVYLLEAREGNQSALNLYQKLGFSSCGVRKKYYADTGEDAILMRLFFGDRKHEEKRQ